MDPTPRAAVTEPPAHKTLLQDIAGVLGLGHKKTIVNDNVNAPANVIVQTTDVVPGDATVVAHAPLIQEEGVTTVTEPAVHVTDETTYIREAARTEVEAASVIKEAPIIHEQAEVRERTVVHEKPIIHEKPVVFEKDVIIEKPVVHEQDVITRIQPVVHEKHVIVERPEIIEKPVIVEKPVLVEKHEVIQRPVIERLNTVIATEKPTYEYAQQTVITEPEIVRTEPTRVEVRELGVTRRTTETVRVEGPILEKPQVTKTGMVVTTRNTPVDPSLQTQFSEMRVTNNYAPTPVSTSVLPGTTVMPASSVAGGIANQTIVADQPVGNNVIATPLGTTTSQPLVTGTPLGATLGEPAVAVSKAGPGVIAETAVTKPGRTLIAEPL